MTGKEIWEEIKKVLESNENESKTYYKIWDTAKAVLRGKFTIMSAYIKKKISQAWLHTLFTSSTWEWEQTDIYEFKANLVYIKKCLASQGYKVRICLKNKTTERSQINNRTMQHRA